MPDAATKLRQILKDHDIDADDLLIVKEVVPNDHGNGQCGEHGCLTQTVGEVKAQIGLVLDWMERIDTLLHKKMETNGQQNVDIAVMKTKVAQHSARWGIITGALAAITVTVVSNIIMFMYVKRVLEALGK